MKQEERKKTILDLLNSKDEISVHDIVSNCDISDITARRDLIELEEKGLLIRTHGGAVKSKVIPELFSFDQRANTNSAQKEKVCAKAAEYVNNSDIIFIDCGTTLYRLAQHISRMEKLVVITNSLPIISNLINFSNINLNIVGGEIVSKRKAIYGQVAEKYISDYHATKAFIGVDGISKSKGLSSYNERESAITRKMAENADEVFLLADSSKIDRDAFVKFASLNIIDYLITDKGITKEQVKEFKELGIKVIISK